MHAGQVLNGRYELLDELGRGGMGEVWRARDRELGRDVAVKGLSEGPTPAAGYRRRLELEAETLASLWHERIVPILDKFVENDQLYLVMQVVPGKNLSKAATTGTLSEAAKLAVLIDVLEALTYLHEETTVVHRDLKPSNILLDQRQRAYVADFGIARSRLDPDSTQSQEVLGSWPYAAPEVRAGKTATHASDVWSFGAIALWLFTGRTFDEGIPEGNFAGSLTDDIRDALSSRRPAASELLQSFRRAEREGVTATVPVIPQDVPTQTLSGVGQPAATAVATAPRRRRWIPAVLVLAALAAITALALTLIRPSGAPATEATTPAVTPSSASATPTPTPTPTVSETPSPTFSETPSRTPTTPTASTPGAPTGPIWYYLADMSPIETEIEGRPGRCTGGCTSFSGQPGNMAGEVYPQSYVMRMDSDGKRSVSTWNAYTKCTTFEATIGLDDSSASVKARFLLAREGGATEDLGILTTGVPPKKISVDLTGVFRFTLVSHLAEASRQTTQKAVWGDARMLCSPLPTPQT